MSKIIQYIIVSAELRNALKRPVGTIIGDCCQAVTAVGLRFRDDHANREFLKDIYTAKSVVVQVYLLIYTDFLHNFFVIQLTHVFLFVSDR